MSMPHTFPMIAFEEQKFARLGAVGGSNAKPDPGDRVRHLFRRLGTLPIWQVDRRRQE